MPLVAADVLRPTGTSQSFTSLVDPVKINNPLEEPWAGHIVVQSFQAGGALELDHLHISPLGATLDVDGDWPDPTAAVASYRHRIVQGRDEKVRVAIRGRLFPFGHRAVLTETALPRAARRRRRRRRRPRDASRADGQGTDQGRQRRRRDRPPVAVAHHRDPQPRSAHPGPRRTPARGVSRLDVAGRPFASACRATDHAGQVVTFSLPLLFVPDTVDDVDARTAWAGQGSEFRQLQLDGQSVGLAAIGDGARAASSPTPRRSSSSRRPWRWPTRRRRGRADHHVVRRLVADPRRARPAGAHDDQLRRRLQQHGFGTGNAGELLVTLTGPLSTIGQGAALVSASMQVRAISRAVGAVASNGRERARRRTSASSPAARSTPRSGSTGSTSSKLFGVFPLGELLPDPTTLPSPTHAPKQTAELIDGRKSFTSTWSTELLQSERREVHRTGGLANRRPGHGPQPDEHHHSRPRHPGDPQPHDGRGDRRRRRASPPRRRGRSSSCSRHPVDALRDGRRRRPDRRRDASAKCDFLGPL